MKKYILSAMIVSMLVTANMGIAMEKEKKMPKTSLSSQQVAELRKAVSDYKKGIDQRKQYQIIAMYRDKYPKDSFVQSKYNEMARFYILQPKEPVKERIEEGSNMRITNKSGQRILIGIQDKPFITVRKEDIGPKETISIYVPQANKEINKDPIGVYVLELKNYDGKVLRDGYGLSKIQPVSKGQIIELEYNNDRTFYPEIWDSFDKIWYRSSEPMRHLYQVRDGKKVPRG
jgi:hypothetical protein